MEDPETFRLFHRLGKESFEDIQLEVAPYIRIVLIGRRWYCLFLDTEKQACVV